MAIARTPVIGKLPVWLTRKNRVVPTPVLDGEIAKSLEQLLEDPSSTDRQRKAATELAGAAPEFDAILANIEADLLKNSCAYFSAEKIRGPAEAPYNGRFLIGKHHLDWDLLVNEANRICVLAARDHGKSFFFTMGFPIWKAGYNAPGSTGYVFSATQPQAEALLKKIKDELLENPELAHLIPYTRDRYWSARSIRLRNGSTIKAYGFGVRVRGGHPDWVVCDDVLNDDDIYSETIRRRNIDYFLSAISGMVHRRKQLIVVGTPMHQADLYAELEQNGEYTCRSYPAEDPTTGEPLWSDRYSRADLQAKRKELRSPARFAREYLCQPLSDEASLFPSKLFAGDSVRLPYVLGLPASYWEARNCLRYTGVDIAMSAEAGADFFVIFTVAVTPDGIRYIANIRREHGWSFSRQIDAIKEEYYYMRPEVIHIEANQAQRVWGDEIIRTTDIPVRRFFTTGVGGRQPLNSWKKGATNVAVNKHHIDRGVPGMRMVLEHQKYRIPRGDENSIKLTDVWIGEMGSIGWINGKIQTVGKHDDTVMAGWMCETAVKMGGRQFEEFLDSSDGSEQTGPLLHAPIVGGVQSMDPASVQAEREALAAVQNGQQVECSKDAYLLRVRQSLYSYATNAVDMGAMDRASHAVAQLQRLDSIHGFRSHDARYADIAKPDPQDYRAGKWAPRERAPTAEDLTIG